MRFAGPIELRQDKDFLCILQIDKDFLCILQKLVLIFLVIYWNDLLIYMMRNTSKLTVPSVYLFFLKMYCDYNSL